jgi:type I restriction enzyme S subunit
MQRDFERMCKKWVNQAAVSSEKIQSLRIPIPSMEIQGKIVEKLKRVLAPIEDKRQKIEKIVENNHSVLIDDTHSFKQRIKRSTNLEYQLLQLVLHEAFSGKYIIEHQAKQNTDKADLQLILEEIRKNKQLKKNDVPFPLTLEDDDLPKIPYGWLWTNIGSFATFIGSGVTPRGGRSVYVNSGIPFIRSQNVHKGTLDFEDISYITPQLHEKMSRTHVHPNDVLLNITGASIGRSAYVPSDFGQANVNQHVCIIRTGSWINPEYLSWWLNSSYIQNIILSIHKGETREGLNYSQIRSMPFPLSSIVEQNQTVSKINQKIMKIELVKRWTFAILESYKLIAIHLDYLPRVILENALSGKLAI